MFSTLKDRTKSSIFSYGESLPGEKPSNADGPGEEVVPKTCHMADDRIPPKHGRKSFENMAARVEWSSVFQIVLSRLSL